MVVASEGYILFVAGAVFGAVTTVAVFRSTQAVHSTRLTQLERSTRRLDTGMGQLQRQMIDLARMCGEKRWTDPLREKSEEE